MSIALDGWQLIQKAKAVAFEYHAGQVDDDGLPYTLHLEQVAKILEAVGAPDYLIAAAWLHDTVEDTLLSENDLKAVFGDKIASLVMEVSHDGQKDEVGFYFPRLKSRDGIILKFADRLSNLLRMSSWDEERKKHYLKKSKFWKESL